MVQLTTRQQWFRCCLVTEQGTGIIYMMTSSNGNIFHVTGHLCGEFTSPGEFLAQRPVTRSFGVFFDLRLNKRLSKQSWGWWFETLSHQLWRLRNVTTDILLMSLGLDEMSLIPVRIWICKSVSKILLTASGLVRPMCLACKMIKSSYLSLSIYIYT